jgi:hypothetical protein
MGLAVVAAAVFVVMLPALASRPNVPAQLVVRPSPPSAQPTPPAAVTPRPVGTSGPPHTSPSATVVPPEQPVVRESDDHGHDGGSDASGEINDR